MNALNVPRLNIDLGIGSIVRFRDEPNIKWVLKHGYYSYSSEDQFGWYFLSIPDSRIKACTDDVLEILDIITVACPCEPTEPRPVVPEETPDGAIDYRNDVNNKPTINDVVVVGDKTAKDFGLQDELPELSAEEVLEIWNSVMR